MCRTDLESVCVCVQRHLHDREREWERVGGRERKERKKGREERKEGGRMYLLLNLKALNSPSRLDKELQDSAWLRTPAVGYKDTPPCLDAFMQVLRVELRFPCLQSKHLTD